MSGTPVFMESKLIFMNYLIFVYIFVNFVTEIPLNNLVNTRQYDYWYIIIVTLVATLFIYRAATFYF